MQKEPSPKPFKTVSSRTAYACPWYAVREDEIILPNGQPGRYHVIDHPGAVWVVPVTAARTIVLIHHYRYTVNDWCWEVPAGGLKPNLSPLELAQQELHEEIGGTSARWTDLGWFYASNGVSSEKAYCFLAEDVELGQTAHEPAEVLTLHEFAADEALAMARRGEIKDGPSALALLLAAPYLYL